MDTVCRTACGRPPLARARTSGGVAGMKKAEQFSRSCVQKFHKSISLGPTEFLAHNEVSEECLYLNVWTGAKTSVEKRAVFVWIYGGAFTEGSTAVPIL
jgi:para-nitrobenzyl esterase